jgi:cytochrome c553
MFIEEKNKKSSKLQRCEMVSWARGLKSIPLLRSLGMHVSAGFYKYFVPTGLVPLAIAALIFTIAIVNSHVHGSVLIAPIEPSPQQQMQFPEGLDYSKFQHDTRNHARLPCLLCHRRDSNAPVPKRPGASNHLPCAGCHAQQFQNAESPICTICHTDVKSGALKAFPRLKSFRMKFDHARHVNMGRVSCATCHRPLRAGVALSIPAGFNAHTAYFNIHSVTFPSGEIRGFLAVVARS